MDLTPALGSGRPTSVVRPNEDRDHIHPVGTPHRRTDGAGLRDTRSQPWPRGWSAARLGIHQL